MRKTGLFVILLLCLAVPASAGEQTFGVGIHYWRAVNELSRRSTAAAPRG